MGYGDHSDLHDHGPEGYYHDRERHEADTRREHQELRMKREIIQEVRGATDKNAALIAELLGCLKSMVARFGGSGSCSLDYSTIQAARHVIKKAEVK